MTEEPGGKKRLREDDDAMRETKQAKLNGDRPAAAPEPASHSTDDDEAPLMNNFKPRASRAVRKGNECPYLDTISRQNLDFDFEKCCSVSLSRINVYVCLVCGKYVQGRGPSTHAYTHALEAEHHLYMKLDSGRVYCLPEMYEVEDRSLSDIQYVLRPTFTAGEVAATETSGTWSRALDGSEYMPGLVGLNNMKSNDYANVIFQALNRVTPVRAFFLRADNPATANEGMTSALAFRFGELLRKMWNPRAFKGHVSPHEVMQAIISASGKRFLIDQRSDPVDFLSWLLNTIHGDLTAGKRRKPSVITDALQGELEAVTEAGSGKAAESTEDITDRLPFLMLGLDLPPSPLYKDSLGEKITIPQIPIFDLLRKYDGETVHHDVRAGRRRLRITRLPKFLVVHVKRFVKNQFFTEKNPTIVNFPVKGLDLGACMRVPVGVPAVYDLTANVVHEGDVADGAYKVQVLRRSEGLWYEVQDLQVTEVLPQVVALSEAYLQVYELRSGEQESNKR